MTNAWRQPADAVGLEDAAVAGRLAREAANPFGRKLAARDLLARFGGDTPDARRRARAALQLAGVATEPPLETAEPHQYVALRPAAPSAAQAAAAGEEGPIVTVLPPRRRVAVGALGLLGLLLVFVVAMLLRGTTGEERGSAFALSADTVSTATTPPAATARTPPPTPATTTPARVAPPPTPAPRRRVRLRIAPTEPSYVCVAEDDGTTIFDSILSRPLVVTRPRVRFRIGVGTARITADGRPIPVRVAPSGFRVTPRGTRQLSPHDPVCA